MPMRLVTSIAIILGLLACNPDKNKRADQNKLRFQTTDDAELFFSNLRQTDYTLELHKAAGFRVYRHKDWPEEVTNPQLRPAIVLNWREDMAYLLLEANSQLTADPLQVLWQDLLKEENGSYSFAYGSKEDHLRFASQLYESLLEGHRLFLLQEQDTLPFLSDPDEREAFRITLLDYYRLTRNIR
jgi:hypothetical protein